MGSLKDAFVDSATRHNKSMVSNHVFAALVATLIVGERKIGNNADLDTVVKEQVAISLGCIVSGHALQEAWKSNDWKLFKKYLTNQEIPQLATVGIGNVSLATASQLRWGQACSSQGDCTSVQLKFQVPNLLGVPTNLTDPRFMCGMPGCITPYPTSATAPYQYEPPVIQPYRELTHQLIRFRENIEYVAANLDAGAQRLQQLRRDAIGQMAFPRPYPFPLAAWHTRGLETRQEIMYSWSDPGHALKVVENMPGALAAMGLSGGGWKPEDDPEYVYFKNR